MCSLHLQVVQGEDMCAILSIPELKVEADIDLSLPYRIPW